MKIPNNVPIELNGQRVWRVYQGGLLLDKLHDNSEQVDGHFPEEWIMSTVSARNKGREHIEDEGLCSLVDEDINLKMLIDSSPNDYLGRKHVDKFNNQIGVLVKLIDSAERLNVQVHPDREKAKELLNSNFGKTECWHILGGRNINGEPPCVYIGFKEYITKEYWRQLFEKQDIEGILNCMHKFEVEKGDTILIEGGVPHAIGAGCFLVEIQEPTDFTFRVEKRTSLGFEVDDKMCHLGVGYDKMFDCFRYECLSKEEVYKKWFIKPKRLKDNDNSKITQLLKYSDTEFFRLNMLDTTEKLQVDLDNVFSGLYVLEGNGKIVSNGLEKVIKQGHQFFIPAGTEKFVLEACSPIKALHFFGPKVM